MQRFVVALALTAVSSAPAIAQDPAVPAAAPDARAVIPTPIGQVRSGAKIPLDVRVTIAKFQGDKRVSSVPYMLAINAVANGNIGNIERAQLTIGSEVPVTSTTFVSSADSKQGPAPLRSFNYRNVGTTIAAAAVPVDADRFELDISIDESSVGTSVAAGQGQGTETMPVFKSFKTRNRLLLRNGQTREFTAATDRVSGETVRIEVTVTAVK
jgi:hypothetical protein